jgi:hypothetical protein
MCRRQLELVEAAADRLEQPVGVRAVRVKRRLSLAELMAVVLSASRGGGRLDALLENVDDLAFLRGPEAIVGERNARDDGVLLGHAAPG